MEPILEVRHLSKSFGKNEVLRDIDFTVSKGDVTSIIGASGSGKSTLLRCINLLETPTSGDVLFHGESVISGRVNASAYRSKVGMVFQSFNLFANMSVLENCMIGQVKVLKKSKAEARANAMKYLEQVGMAPYINARPRQISGGQKQRVSLAGVMVDQVKILMFDEPLASLDPATGKQAIELIDEIQKKTDTTVLIIEHRLEDVLWRNVDRIVLVNGGTILADLRPDELLSGSLLAENGIREPLYVTALRYAGVDITPDKHPAHVDSLVLDDTDTQKLRDWFTARPRPAAQPEREPLLEVKGLSFGYQKGQQTLRDVSFSIGKGEMVSIVGRNGAGKSTLSKLICGFETPDAGEIFLNGKPLAEENIRRRAQHIGYVMQNPNQMISKTMIYEEVALGLQRSGLTEEQIREKVEATLRVCGLYPFRNWPISALSFGQKKRVTIASVLVLDPELILLDEPTAGQDFRHYTDIMEFLRGLNARGVTVVMITHDMHLMLEYTRRALVFCDGRLIADRTAAAVLCDPALVEQAALKETSLYTLANRCGIAPAQEFVERFIEQDREVREGGR